MDGRPTGISHFFMFGCVRKEMIVLMKSPGYVSRTINSLSGGRGRPPYNIFHNLWVGHWPMRNCLLKSFRSDCLTHHLAGRRRAGTPALLYFS
jgi:hypothetical protein